MTADDQDWNDDKTVITNNRHEECFNTGNKEKIETESNYQDKLGANRYAALSDDNDDVWNTHLSQYVEKEEKPGRMREIGNATERHASSEEEAIRNSPYGSLTKRMSEIGKATKRHAPKGEEANKSVTKRISPNKMIIKMDATIRHTQYMIENTSTGNAIDRVETSRFSQIVIPTTNVGDIRNIPTKNYIPTQNNEKRMHSKHTDNGIKQEEQMNTMRIKTKSPQHKQTCQRGLEHGTRLCSQNGYKTQYTTAMQDCIRKRGAQQD